ncbi:MAG TPA: hypothetical protein VMM36_02800 [Opitutaceae bacterium]|nr:hypothetical protein [Opitutaceae bacterium]
MKTRFRIGLFALAALAYATPSFALPGKPGFAASLWGDGRLWSSKATAILPAPTEKNLHSYDMLFVIINSNADGGQFPVAEAAPGNPDFNSGRWFVHTAWWTEQGLAWYGTVPVITSYAELLEEVIIGNMAFAPGSPAGGPPPYFQCPMLPVKN